MRIWMLVAALVLAGCGEVTRDGDWRAPLDAAIERHRKSDFAVRVVDADGKPLADAAIDYAQIRSDFLFGTAVNLGALRRDDELGERYRAFILEHFNCVVDENHAKWYSTEKERGKVDWSGAEAIAGWAEAHDLALRGHCLFWSRDKFVKWQPWLFALDGEELRAAVAARIERAVTRFRGRVIAWDVNNEMLDGDFYESRLPGIRVEMFRRVHELDPDARLFANEFGVLGGDKVDRYLELIEDLRADGAPVTGIGVQEHACERFATSLAARVADDDGNIERVGHEPLAIARARADLDRYAATGLPVHFTEVSCKSPDEAARAEGLETIYRLAYSHPGVDALLIWGFWAKAHWLGADAALMDADGELNAAGRRISRLLREEWRSRGDVRTDAAGRLRWRGFYGTYRLTGPDGATAEASFTVDGGPDQVRLTGPDR